MYSMNYSNVKQIISRDETKPISILLLSVIITAVHKCFGSIEFANKSLPGISQHNAVMYLYLSTFVLFGIIPLLIIKLGFNESIKDYGLNIGNWEKGLKFIAIIFPLIVLVVLYPSLNDKELTNFYPQSKDAGSSIISFIKFEAIHILLFYSGWEIFFRGFILFGLRKYVGDAMAICIQIIPSCLWHLGMATGEIFASILGGVIFGILALKTRSILYPFILHFLIGVALDLLIVLSI